MNRKTLRLRIEGHVQGVGYRAFVERRAVSLGLDGWVRNRRDGGVETVVSGPTADVDQLIADCRAGPRGSRVDMLKILEELDVPVSGFQILPTA